MGMEKKDPYWCSVKLYCDSSNKMEVWPHHLPFEQDLGYLFINGTLRQRSGNSQKHVRFKWLSSTVLRFGFFRFWNSKKFVRKTQDTSEKDCITMKIPFIGSASTKFAKSLSCIFEETFGSKLTPVYTSFKVKTYFGLKSKSPKFLCSNVVYKFNCLCDTDICYIGVTSRPLGIRVNEHLEQSESL